MVLNESMLSFDKCEDEPIHRPETIQCYGYLMAVDQYDFSIQIYSSNLTDLFLPDQPILGVSIFDLLTEENDNIDFLKQTIRNVETKKIRLPIKIKFKEGILGPDNALEFLSVVYKSDNYFVIELEPSLKFRLDERLRKQQTALYGYGIASQFANVKSIRGLTNDIVQTVRYITGMERVVIYRFNEDNSGTVIAESKVDDIESYLHLHFPADDIPAQARELYKKNWIRLVPDADLEECELVPTLASGDRTKPLDLSQSILRSLSPIHLQYVRNQGLKASMSMSLVAQGKLWGIISCHNRQALYIPQNVRLECEILSQLFSSHIFAKQEEFYLQKKAITDHAIDLLLKKDLSRTSIIEVFRDNVTEVLEILNADGFMFVTRDEQVTIGQTPDIEEIIKLNEKSVNDKKPFISSRNISDDIDSTKASDIRGMMLIRLVDEKDYFTAWFRKEKKEIEKWIGTPGEKRRSNSRKERLLPRQKFEVHEVLIENRSKKWTKRDVEIAKRFNRVYTAYSIKRQEELRQNISDLQLQDKYKNEFLATLAHELRNPLTPVITGVSLLKQNLPKEQFDKVLTMMERQSGHISTMIDDLMDVSRITQGKVKMDLESLEIEKVLTNALQACDKIIQDKMHQVTINFNAQNIFVLGDETRLSQVFVNVINNAAKYTHKKGRIKIVTDVKDDTVLIVISDNGIGLDQQDTHTIFDMFKQVDNDFRSGGLGLGLTLVKNLIGMHNGTITAHSKGKGQGSKFIMSLPITNDINKKEIQINEEIELNNSDKKILIVDDNEDILSIYAIVAKKAGYRISNAYNGKECISKIKDFKPDLVLMDIGLPDTNGYELCKRAKTLPEAVNTIFVSQSGWGDKEHFIKSKEAGFIKHYVKPLSISDLNEIMEL